MHNSDKGFFAGFIGMALLAILANLIFWGALIYGAFWTANHFGVI